MPTKPCSASHVCRPPNMRKWSLSMKRSGPQVNLMWWYDDLQLWTVSQQMTLNTTLKDSPAGHVWSPECNHCDNPMGQLQPVHEWSEIGETTINRSQESSRMQGYSCCSVGMTLLILYTSNWYSTPNHKIIKRYHSRFYPDHPLPKPTCGFGIQAIPPCRWPTRYSTVDERLINHQQSCSFFRDQGYVKKHLTSNSQGATSRSKRKSRKSCFWSSTTELKCFSTASGLLSATEMIQTILKQHAGPMGIRQKKQLKMISW